MEKRFLAQILGEIVLMLPILFLAFLLGILGEAMIAMLSFCIFKFHFKVEHPFHFASNLACVTTTFCIFIGIGLATLGLQTSIPVIGRQPVFSGILGVVAAYVWANLGEVQGGRYTY